MWGAYRRRSRTETEGRKEGKGEKDSNSLKNSFYLYMERRKGGKRGRGRC